MRRIRIAAGVVLGMTALSGGAFGAGEQRFTPGTYALTIDGESEIIQKISGGTETAEVVTEPGSAFGTAPAKHLGVSRTEPVSVELGLSMGDPMLAWIDATLENRHERKDASVDLADQDYVPKRRIDMLGCLLTEIGFPACDGTAKDAGHMTVQVLPERIRDGVPPSVFPKPPKRASKPWVPSNFRFTLGDLPTKRVLSIDAFTAKQPLVVGPTGGDKGGETGQEPQKVPGRIEIPNLVVTIDATDAQAWLDWHQRFVVEGRNSDADELGGSLEYLDANLKDVIGVLEFAHVGMVGLSRIPPSPVGGRRPPLVVELYVESMHLRRTPAGN